MSVELKETDILFRVECVVCGGKLEHLTTLKNFPIYMGVSEEIKNINTDMEWASCKDCGCVQLQKLIEPHTLYMQPHNPSIGKVWQEHNESFSNLIANYKFDKILEIGGANLKIANLLSKKSNFFSYDIIDYSSNEYSVTKINNKINLIKSSAEEYATKNKVDCVIMSHTFEHFYQPSNVLSKLSECINDEGYIFISVPNIKNQLIDGFLNALNFEHTFYIDDRYVEIIANKSNFYLLKIIEFSKYNSFYVLKKNNGSYLTNLQHNRKEEAKNNLFSFINKIQKDVENIKKNIKDKKVFIFGAHIFTQILLNFGLSEDSILHVLDNDPDKQEKYLFGTKLIVKNPLIMENSEEPWVILRAAQYSEEIKLQLDKVNHNIKYI